jgi:hypothetical protein
VLPEAAHAGEVVLELRELHLQLSLGGDGMLGKDVEDELGAIDDAQLQLVLEPTLLTGIEVVVDDQRLGIRPGHRFLQLRELALADVGARVGSRPPLQELPHGLDTGGAHELAHLPQLLGFFDPLRQHRDEKAALRLSPGRGVRLVLCHRLIMPSPRPEAKMRSGGLPLRGVRRRP